MVSTLYTNSMERIGTICAKKLPPFDRRITQEEYDAVLSYLYLLELDNGYTQDFSAASAEYIPEFDLEGL